LNGETIPLLLGETTRVLSEAEITSSSVELPKRRPLRAAVRRLVKGQSSSYAASKRGPLELNYIEAFLEQCRLNGAGKGHVSLSTKEYAVVEPA
jgi:hypothetical protein